MHNSAAPPAQKQALADELADLLTVDDLVAAYGVGRRWLADQCRANRVEHVYMSRKRLFTKAQAEAIVAQFTVRPAPTAREREMARIAKRKGGMR
ncbi:MAG: hypothetical protein ACRDXX_13120 [Stackebrandtia sp.]